MMLVLAASLLLIFSATEAHGKCPPNTAEDGALACSKMRYKRSIVNEMSLTTSQRGAVCKEGYRLEIDECVAICAYGSRDTGTHCSRRMNKRWIGAISKFFNEVSRKPKEIIQRLGNMGSCLRLPRCGSVDCRGVLNLFRGQAGQSRMSTYACKSLYHTVQSSMHALSNVQKCLNPSWGTVSLSIAVGASAGIAASAEVGVAIDRGSGKGICFIGGCVGLKTDLSVGGELIFGVWRSLDSIPGESFVIGGGVDIPLTEVGGSISTVTAGGRNIGTTFSLGVGIGVMPIELGGYRCNTPQSSVVDFNL